MVANKVALAKNFHIQPSEFEIMPYWEYELFIKKLNEMIKEESKKNEEEENKYKQQYNPNSYKTPKIPGYNPPKIPSIPKH